MAIPVDAARKVIGDLRQPFLANLFAQADAKFILKEVGEDQSNFPGFSPLLDERATYAAYALLGAGCSLVEQAQRAEGATALVQGASILGHVYGADGERQPDAGFHQLVCGMALYAAGHYSRAFVAVRASEERTPAARIIATFLRKDVRGLIGQLNNVLLGDTPPLDGTPDLDEWAITTVIARVVALALEYVFTGDAGSLEATEHELDDALVLAASSSSPVWWWILRLLRIMLMDLGRSSPWRILPPYFEPEDRETVGRYVRGLAFSRRPIAELWASQQAALPLALNLAGRGAVVNLRTSAGKTRVAELAILRTLVADPLAQVIYIAPFRSLAIEIERTLSDTLGWMGYAVSHLYGGSRVSSVDTELMSGSAITIATPEKIRALFRAAPELFKNVKLVVVDEGHLIGPSERYVRNELFVDHLRSLTSVTSARILLLSAVLPNPEQLAEWVSGDPTAVARSDWKPSSERFGLLRWNGLKVRLEWLGEVGSFNPAFVTAEPLGFGRRRKPFPANKNEAIAATAIRLSSVGPVMIFTARANSVANLAESVLRGLGETPETHKWPQHEWEVFEAVCQEELNADAVEFRAARAGVICHCNRLTTQVRLAMEQLMRSAPPRVIVATTTLAQGVNVGISTVIVATPYISEETITKRDFWNICGRAGRAFVDGEGKILYAIDDTREKWQIDRDESLAQWYFDAGQSEPVESGVLHILTRLRTIAAEAGVGFERLLELAANDDYSSLGSGAADVAGLCDQIDDALLGLHEDSMINPATDATPAWVDRVFRGSLAAIQARLDGVSMTEDDVVQFLRARVDSTLTRVPGSARKAVVSSGLPISVALRVSETLEVLRDVADSYLASDRTLPPLVDAVRSLENWARREAPSIVIDMPDIGTMDRIRDGWLGGVGLQLLTSMQPDASGISKDCYGYQLPWLTHACSQQLRSAGELERADALAVIALLVELGVPTELAARIFLAGVRSRSAATELASLDLAFGETVGEIARTLGDAVFAGGIQLQVSPGTRGWLGLLVADAARTRYHPIPTFPPFTLRGVPRANHLQVRRSGNQITLCSVDGRIRLNVEPTADLPFDRVADDPRVAFSYSDGAWRLDVRDPRVEQLPGSAVN